jgi:CHAD domain-containing protein
VRKAVKRARYAAELAAAVGTRGTGKYLKRAKKLQDVLGDHQDAVVATEAVRELGDRGRSAAVEALVDRQNARRAAARAAAPRAWKRFDRQGRSLKHKLG